MADTPKIEQVVEVEGRISDIAECDRKVCIINLFNIQVGTIGRRIVIACLVVDVYMAGKFCGNGGCCVTVFDKDAEYGEAYVSGFCGWLEKLPSSILKKQKGKLLIRYSLSGKILSIEVFFHERLLDTLQQTLSPKGIAAISQFIAKNGSISLIH